MSMRNIYRQVAKQHGVSVSELKREMQLAVNSAYESPGLYARCVPCQGDIPTPEEMIRYSARRIQLTYPKQK